MIFSQSMTEVELIVPSKDMLPVTRLLANQGIFHQADASYLNPQSGVESTESMREQASAYASLERHKAGRAYLYAPVADQPGLAARRMARVLDSEADREAVLARFVSSLSDSDEELLRRMLGENGMGGDPGPRDSGG